MQYIDFISVAEIFKRTNLDENIEEKKIKIAIHDTQVQILQPILGSALYNVIRDGVRAKQLATDYQDLLNNQIYEVLVKGVEFKIAINILYRYANSSVVSQSNENATAISRGDLTAMRKEAQESLDTAKSYLKYYLEANSGTYPEYIQTSNDGIPSAQSVSPSNFYFGYPDSHVF